MGSDRRSWACTPAVCLMLLLSRPVAAQPAAPDPRALLEAAAGAARRVEAVTYRATFETVFPGAQPAVVRTEGVVELQRGGSPEAALAGRLRVASSGYGGRQEISYDGAVARRLDHERKLLTEGRVERGGVAVAMGSPAVSLLSWTLLEAEPLQYERAATRLAYVGLGAIGGVLCHVLDARFELPGVGETEERLWLALADSLPRAVQRASDSPGGRRVQELRITELRRRGALGAASFEIPLPEGYAYQPYTPGPSPKPLAVGTEAPDWELRDAAGRAHRLSDFRGRAVVLNFWSSWCGYSNLGLDAVRRLAARFRDREVRFVGINLQERDGVDASAYLKSKGGDYLNLLNGDEASEAYGVRGVPAFYVIDPEGKVAYASLLYFPELRSRLEEAVARLVE